jgi:hypothetical protein
VATPEKDGVTVRDRVVLTLQRRPATGQVRQSPTAVDLPFRAV